MTSNVPEIRFNGYDGEWEKSSFSEIFDRVRSYPLSRDMETEEDSGVKYIHYGDIHVGKANKVTEVSRIPNIRTGKYEYLNKGDIVLADASEDYQGIAKPSVIVSTTSFNIVAGLHTIALRPKKDNSLFVYYLLFAPTFRRYGYKTGTGMKVFGISITNILKFETSFPDLQEQQAIGSFFKELDDRIALQQTSLESLKETKQGFLQKMFPKKGETTPEIRFDGFEGEWEEVKLGDVSDMFDNLRVPVKSSDRVSGATPYYGANGIQGYVFGYTHEGEYILIAEDGASDLKNYPVNYVNGRVWVNNHAHVVQGSSGIAITQFLMYFIKSMDITPYLVGGGRAKLNGEVLKKLPITLPKIEEQQAIGSFFKELDDAIALEERELELLKETKKAFLQKMFV